MVVQNPKKCNHEMAVLDGDGRLDDVAGKVNALLQWVRNSAQEGTAAHEVERELFNQLLQLGKTLFQGFLDLVGPGDFGPQVTLDDGRLVQRSEKPHPRRLVTVFGAFRIAR